MKALAVAGLDEQALSAGDLDRADGLFRESIILKHELRDTMGVAVGLDSLARTATAQGNGERAALLLGAAERIWRRSGCRRRETRSPSHPRDPTVSSRHAAFSASRGFVNISGEGPSWG